MGKSMSRSRDEVLEKVVPALFVLGRTDLALEMLARELGLENAVKVHATLLSVTCELAKKRSSKRLLRLRARKKWYLPWGGRFKMEDAFRTIIENVSDYDILVRLVVRYPPSGGT